MASSTDANTISYLSGTKLAVASLIIGIASLFTFTLMLVGSISGIVLGLIALRGVKDNPARGRSKAMAIAGIILSIVAFLPPYFYAAGNANAACTEKRLQSIGAAEARELGIVNQVASDWLGAALELAELVAQRPPLAVRLGKQAVLAADETPLSAGLDHERRLYELAMATEDRVEGMTAFVEKRKPEFKGR